VQSSSIRDVIGALPTVSRVDLEWSLTVGYLDMVVRMLTRQETDHFPSLALNKGLRAFRNGVYDLITDQFFLFNDKLMPEGFAVCFYDIEFNMQIMGAEYASFTDFHGSWLRGLQLFAPAFYSIIEWQFPKKNTKYKTESFNMYKDPELCVRTFCAFFGRLFHEVCRVDSGWEKLMALIGHSQTGKSQLGILATLIQPIHMIAKNDPEKVFGLMSLVGKDFILWEEASENSNFQYDVFLQIGSSRGRAGQKIAVSRKNDTQVDVHITATMLMTGNSAPKFDDGEKQISRRFMAFLFDRPVLNKDLEIPTKLVDEIPVILALCNRAYHCFHRGTQGHDVDAFIHPDLKRDVSQILNASSEVSAFLFGEKSPVNCDREGVKSAKIIPIRVLEHAFETFVKKHTGCSHKSMTSQDLNNLLVATKAKVFIREDEDSKSDRETNFGYPKYDEYKWPFLDNCDYVFSPGTERYSTQRTISAAYVQGIEINWVKCVDAEVSVLVDGSGDSRRRSGAFFQKWKGSSERQRTVFKGTKKIGGISSSEKNNLSEFYDARRGAFSTTQAVGVLHSFNTTLKKTKPMKDEMKTDAHGVTKFDNELLKQLKNHIDLQLLAESKVVRRRSNQAKRFVGFEMKGCYVRLQRALARAPPGSRGHLRFIIKGLKKIMEAYSTWDPYY
jgi:hypothetical protein